MPDRRAERGEEEEARAGDAERRVPHGALHDAERQPGHGHVRRGGAGAGQDEGQAAAERDAGAAPHGGERERRGAGVSGHALRARGRELAGGGAGRAVRRGGG